MNFVKGALIFIGGGLVGAGATYFFMKDRMEKKLQATVDDMREYMEERSERERECEMCTVDSLTEAGREEMIARYKGYLQQLGYAEPDEEEDPVSAVNPPDDEVGIEAITSEEFTDGFPGYDSMTVSFYAGDNTWVGADETILSEDDICDAVGNDLYDRIEEVRKNVTVETDSMYVCNHERACLYEIMFLPGAFTAE